MEGERGTPGTLAAPLSLVRDLSLLSSGGGSGYNERRSAGAPRVRGRPTARERVGRGVPASLSISRMPPQPQKRLMLEAFFFGLHGKG